MSRSGAPKYVPEDSLKSPRFTTEPSSFIASSGCTAPNAASEAEALRHSVGLSPSSRLSSIWRLSSGTQPAHRPRAAAT